MESLISEKRSVRIGKIVGLQVETCGTGLERNTLWRADRNTGILISHRELDEKLTLAEIQIPKIGRIDVRRLGSCLRIRHHGRTVVLDIEHRGLCWYLWDHRGRYRDCLNE